MAGKVVFIALMALLVAKEALGYECYIEVDLSDTASGCSLCETQGSPVVTQRNCLNSGSAGSTAQYCSDGEPECRCAGEVCNGI